jgi:CBS domain-containing protein
VLADNPPADAAAWFAGLAEHLAATLERCGLPRCPGEVMATNPARRLPRRAWQQQFSSWIQEPEEEARRRRCWMRPSVSTSASSTATWTPRRRCGR